MASSEGRDRRPKTQVMLQTYFTGKTLQKGIVYRMSPRLVDFNINRVLLNLVQMDFQSSVSGEKVPFMDMITYPITFAKSRSYCGPMEPRRQREIVRGLKELAKLGVKDAAALLLKPSQQRAAMRMMMRRLSVIWGPPGKSNFMSIKKSQ
jgi:hypothetical protein